jgi:hypothetical protein
MAVRRLYCTHLMCTMTRLPIVGPFPESVVFTVYFSRSSAPMRLRSDFDEVIILKALGDVELLFRHISLVVSSRRYHQDLHANRA